MNPTHKEIAEAHGISVSTLKRRRREGISFGPTRGVGQCGSSLRNWNPHKFGTGLSKDQRLVMIREAHKRIQNEK